MLKFWLKKCALYVGIYGKSWFWPRVLCLFPFPKSCDWTRHESQFLGVRVPPLGCIHTCGYLSRRSKKLHYLFSKCEYTCKPSHKYHWLCVCEFSAEKHQINQVLIFSLAARKIPASVNRPSGSIPFRLAISALLLTLSGGCCRQVFPNMCLSPLCKRKKIFCCVQQWSLAVWMLIIWNQGLGLLTKILDPRLNPSKSNGKIVSTGRGRCGGFCVIDGILRCLRGHGYPGCIWHQMLQKVII